MGQQLQKWSVCQICGKVIPRGTGEDWIDSDSLQYPDVRIVRCPQHWSERALRKSSMGRTRANYRKLYRLIDEHEKRGISRWTREAPWWSVPARDE